jgi:hypothetical protein
MEDNKQIPLSLLEIQAQIIAFNKNSAIQEYYNQKSYLEILGIARRETCHSSLIAWLLNPLESHGLSNFGLRRLLEILITSKFKDKLKFSQHVLAAITIGKYKLNVDKLVTEYMPIDNNEEKNQIKIDIYIEFSILPENQKENKFRLILENKVQSTEQDRQTEKYYNFFSKQKNRKIKNIFVYLTPLSEIELAELPEQECADKHFVQINYQMLLNDLFQSALARDLSPYTRAILEQYVLSLRRPAFDPNKNNNQKVLIMAYNTEERNLLNEFWDANKNLIMAALDAKRSDPDAGPDERKEYNDMYEIARKNRPNLNFTDIGIPIESELIFTEDESVKVTVIADKKVLYRGKEYSLTGLAQELMGKSSSLRGPLYWKYNGDKVSDIYDKKYPPEK